MTAPPLRYCPQCRAPFRGDACPECSNDETTRADVTPAEAAHLLWQMGKTPTLYTTTTIRRYVNKGYLPSRRGIRNDLWIPVAALAKFKPPKAGWKPGRRRKPVRKEAL